MHGLGIFLITTVQVLWDANQCAGLAVGWCRMSCRMAAVKSQQKTHDMYGE